MPRSTSYPVLRAAYVANVAMAGWVGATNVFAPALAEQATWGGLVRASPATTILGCIWLTGPACCFVVVLLLLLLPASSAGGAALWCRRSCRRSATGRGAQPALRGGSRVWAPPPPSLAVSAGPSLQPHVPP